MHAQTKLEPKGHMHTPTDATRPHPRETQTDTSGPCKHGQHTTQANNQPQCAPPCHDTSQPCLTRYTTQTHAHAFLPTSRKTTATAWVYFLSQLSLLADFPTSSTMAVSLAVESSTAAGDWSQLAPWSCQPVSMFVARIPVSTIPEDVHTSAHVYQRAVTQE